MKKSILWITGIVLIILILVFFFVFIRNPKTLNSNSPTDKNKINNYAFQFKIDPSSNNTYCENGVIVVGVDNLGSKDITSNDWTIHKIDGKSVDVMKYVTNVPAGGTAMVLSTDPQIPYSSGQHKIELGTSDGNLQTYTIDCVNH